MKNKNDILNNGQEKINEFFNLSRQKTMFNYIFMLNNSIIFECQAETIEKCRDKLLKIIEGLNI